MRGRRLGGASSTSRRRPGCTDVWRSSPHLSSMRSLRTPSQPLRTPAPKWCAPHPRKQSFTTTSNARAAAPASERSETSWPRDEAAPRCHRVCTPLLRPYRGRHFSRVRPARLHVGRALLAFGSGGHRLDYDTSGRPFNGWQLRSAALNFKTEAVPSRRLMTPAVALSSTITSGEAPRIERNR